MYFSSRTKRESNIGLVRTSNKMNKITSLSNSSLTSRQYGGQTHPPDSHRLRHRRRRHPLPVTTPTSRRLASLVDCATSHSSRFSPTSSPGSPHKPSISSSCAPGPPSHHCHTSGTKEIWPAHSPCTTLHVVVARRCIAFGISIFVLPHYLSCS